LAPTLKHSQIIYEDVLKKNANNKIWLDLGCGKKLLAAWRYNEEKKLVQKAKLLVGIDYDFSSLKNHKTIKYMIRGDILNLPFADCSFGLVTSNMVFEHIREPKILLGQIYRILKPRGTLLMHTPNLLGYGTILARIVPSIFKGKLVYFLQNRKESDVFRTYYRINSKRKIKQIALETGFLVEKIRLTVTSAQLVMLPPLVIFELLLIRMLMTRYLKEFRTNIIAKLKKPESISPAVNNLASS
jgi:ubiquinone/menaquinone biosynthesis C-methylase UbiE